MPESSQQNTTQLFISSFFVQQASIFWSSALTSGVASRAKIIATGLAPKRQYRQDFSPAAGPVMFSGSNGPGTLSPTCGPDFTFSAAARPPKATTRATAAATIRIFVMELFLRLKQPTTERPRRPPHLRAGPSGA